MSRRIALGVVAVVAAAACAFLITVLVRQGVDRAGVWAGPLSALTGIVGTAAAVWALVPRKPEEPLPAEPEPLPDWVVPRPEKLDAVVQALTGEQAGPLGITIGLTGEGGFGKTILAQMVCADPQVRRRFKGRVYWVRVGQDVRNAATVAATVSGVIRQVFDKDASFTDPQAAGARLGSLLDAGPRRLLILDDVWREDQLAPLLKGGKRCARLVTTRVPELLQGRGTVVPVDQMSSEQARDVLTSELPRLDPAVVAGLLKVTRQWPLLLRLVSQILANVAPFEDVPALSARAADLLQELVAGGPVAIEGYLGAEDQALLRATIEAGMRLLADEDDAKRFAELGVFAAVEIIPFHLVALLWCATADRNDLQAAQISQRLAKLALVLRVSGPGGGLGLHDVIRDFLRARLEQQQRLAELTALLLDSVVSDVFAPSTAGPAAEGPGRAAWWEMGDQDPYLWDHLIEHMVNADGRAGAADAVAGDLRWVQARLERFGPVGPAADLAVIGTPRAARLRGVFARIAHLLAPTEPAEAVIDVLYSRVADDPDWGPQVKDLEASRRRPRLVNRWPLPDPPDLALRRVLTGHLEAVVAVAVALDGTWLASGSQDGTVRTWDAATGRESAVLTGHFGAVAAVAVAPDGSWLVSGGQDGTVRTWDAATGRVRAVLTGHADAVAAVAAVAVAPDGSWLAVGDDLGTVRLWEVPATGRERSVHERAVLRGHAGAVAAVVVAPDGSWLASGGADGTVRIWDAVTRQERVAPADHGSAVAAVLVAPDGSWLASGGLDSTVRIWDAATGRQRAAPAGHSSRPAARAVALAPEASWLASGNRDRMVRIWDTTTGAERAVLTGHASGVAAVVVAPDGRWLASGGADGTVRIWDAVAGRERVAPAGRTSRPSVAAVAVAPDGRWLASGGLDSMVRIWDAVTGRERAVLAGHTGPVAAVAVAPDSRWLASGGQDSMVRIWKVATGGRLAVLEGHTGAVAAIAVAPDGRWLASGSEDNTVRTWDVDTGRERATLAGHDAAVAAVAVAPDGRWLASGSEDKTVRIWDAATGKKRATLAGHAGGVAAVAVAPDGRWLASGGRDGTLRIWDAATWAERAVLDGRVGEVGAVAVAPDGRWLASGERAGTLRIWEVATGQACTLMRVDNNIRACAWLGPDALVLSGPAGLYLFGFRTERSPAAPDHGVA